VGGRGLIASDFAFHGIPAANELSEFRSNGPGRGAAGNVNACRRYPGHDQHMPIRIQCVCVDTAGPARIASFWESALGWRRTWDEEGQVCLEPPEGRLTPDELPPGHDALGRRITAGG
jgi:hypothetical protein